MRTKLLVAAVAVALSVPASAANLHKGKEDNVVSPQHWEEQVSVSNVVDASAAYAKVADLSEGAVLSFYFESGYGVPKYVAHLAEEGKIRQVEVNGESGEVTSDEVHNPFPGEAPTLSEKQALTKASELVTGAAESISYEFHGGDDEGAYRIVLNDKDSEKLYTLVISSKTGNVLMKTTEDYGFDWDLWDKKPNNPDAKKPVAVINGAQKLLDTQAQPKAGKEGFWDDFWWNLPVDEPTWISVDEAIDKAQAQVEGLTLSVSMDVEWDAGEDDEDDNDELFTENFKVRIFDTDHIATVILKAKDGALIEKREGPIKQVSALDSTRTTGDAIQALITVANEKSNNAQIMDLSIYRDSDNENKLTYVIISQDSEKVHVSRFDAATGDLLSYKGYEL